MFVYINGIKYDRCGSQYFHKHCADRSGHNGKHHNGHLWWTNSEAEPSAPEVPDFPHLPHDVAHAIAEFDRKVNTPELPLGPDGHPVIPPQDERWIADFLHTHIPTEI